MQQLKTLAASIALALLPALPVQADTAGEKAAEIETAAEGAADADAAAEQSAEADAAAEEEEEAKGGLTMELAVMSDYVWRGFSQTDGGPAIQGTLEYEHESGFYVGTFASNVDFDEDVKDPARIEVDVYGGLRGETEFGLGWDIGVLRYIYPDSTVSYDYNDYNLALSYDFLSFEFSYSNDFWASGKNGFYYGIGASHEFPDLFTLAAKVGYSDVDDGAFGEDTPNNYVDWSVGVSREMWGINFDLTYTDTNDNGQKIAGSQADARVVFSASISF